MSFGQLFEFCLSLDGHSVKVQAPDELGEATMCFFQIEDKKRPRTRKQSSNQTLVQTVAIAQDNLEEIAKVLGISEAK